MKKRVLGFLLAGLAVFAMAGGAWATNTTAAKVIQVTFTGATVTKTGNSQTDIVVDTSDTTKVTVTLGTGHIADVTIAGTSGKPAQDAKTAGLVNDSDSLTVNLGATKAAPTVQVKIADSADDLADAQAAELKYFDATAVYEGELNVNGAYYLEIPLADSQYVYLKFTIAGGWAIAPITVTETSKATITPNGGDPVASNNAAAIVSTADGITVYLDNNKVTDATAGTHGNLAANSKSLLNTEDTAIEITLKTAETPAEFTGATAYAVPSTSATTTLGDAVAADKLLAGTYILEVMNGENSWHFYVTLKNPIETNSNTTGSDISFDVTLTDGTTTKTVEVLSDDVKTASFDIASTTPTIAEATSADKAGSDTLTVASSATSLTLTVTSGDKSYSDFTLFEKVASGDWTKVEKATIPAAGATNTYRVAVKVADKKYAVVEFTASMSSSSDDSGTTVEEKLNSIAPKVTVKAITEAIRRAFASFFSGTIYDLYSSSTVATSADQKVISDEVVGDLASNQTAIVLPRVTITTAGVYAFTMDLSSYKGRTLTLNVVDLSTYVPTVTSYNLDLAANVSALSDAKFLDKNGNTLTTSSDYSEVNAAATFSAGSFVPYVVATSSSSDTTTTSPKSGNSGCDMGLTGGLAVLLAALLPLRGKRG